MATWTNVAEWMYILFATWILLELILYAREYWRYYRKRYEIVQYRRER
jgi:hypothetical protein